MSTSTQPDRTITFELETVDGDARLSGFRWFWAMVVTGFDDRRHCLACLKGKRIVRVRPRWLAGERGRVSLQVPAGALVYICGVSDNYVWDRNFHLALRPLADAHTRSETYNGHTVSVAGAEELEIPVETAAAQYPDLGPAFLTCRNFQFAAHYFGEQG